MGAVKMMHESGMRPTMVGTGDGGSTPHAHRINGFANGDVGAAAAALRRQSELARLRARSINSKENAQQAQELQQAMGVLSTNSESVGGAELSLQVRVQAQQAELQDARLRAQQSAGVAAARQREMESLQKQVSALQLQLRSSQMETVSARSNADEASAEAAEARRLQLAAREEVSQAMLRANAAEESLAAESARVQVSQSQLNSLQAQLQEAESKALAAEASKRSAEEETRRALPVWQEQLRRAETQLRQLSAQFRDKDAQLSERERELADKEVALGQCEVSLSESRRAAVSAEERLRTTQQLYEALEAEKQSLLSERAETSDAKWELVTLKSAHSALQKDMAEATEGKNALRSQLDDVSEQLRQLRQMYRTARDEIASLNASYAELSAQAAASAQRAQAAEGAPPSPEMEAEVLTLRERLAGGRERCAGRCRRRREIRQLKEETLNALKSEAAAASDWRRRR